MFVNAAEFGLVGDGQTDNSPGLIKLRDQLRTDRDRLWHVYFPPGHYVYENNRWLLGVGRVDIKAHGATFECVAQDNCDRNHGPLALQQPHESWGDQKFTTVGDVQNIHAGYRFASAEQKGPSVALLEPCDVSPGDVVLLAGYAQQGVGWPLSLRYFEYKAVADVAEDVVSFVEPLRHEYDGEWPECSETLDSGRVTYGAPRLYLCNRPGYDIIKDLTIDGARFAWNRNYRDTAQQNKSLRFTGVLQLTLDRLQVHGADLVVGSCQQVSIRDCDLESVDLDKLVDWVTFDGGTVYGDIGSRAGAIEVLELNHTRVIGRLDIVPRTLIANSVEVQKSAVFSRGPMMATSFMLTGDLRSLD